MQQAANRRRTYFTDMSQRQNLLEASAVESPAEPSFCQGRKRRRLVYEKALSTKSPWLQARCQMLHGAGDW
eukprot:5423427-Pyramimonas_sp.AAC.1